MKIAFDLDGTLDKPVLASLAKALLASGHEVFVITGVFLEAGAWQSPQAKEEKLARLGIPFERAVDGFPSILAAPRARMYVLNAADTTFPLEYRLRDLGLRKGALCEKLGIDLILDDSETYCGIMKAMHGGLTVLQVR